MAVHKGSEGAIKIGSATVAEVKSYSLDESADTIETSNMGSSARTYLSSLTSFSGSVDCMWDETDSSQNALAVGSTVTLLWYPEGSGTGATFYSGSVIVTGKNITGSFDGLVEASIAVQGSGAITTATV
jgi:hypothetical protein